MKLSMKRLILPGTGVLVAVLLGTAPCQAGQTAQQTEKKLEQAIHTGQKAQKGLDAWESEKARLIVEYETLSRHKEALETEHKALSGQLTALAQENRELTVQKHESTRIRTEMIPFLEEVYHRLQNLVDVDPPFLKEERKVRLDRLGKVLKDPGIAFSEKYRKVMEALFIEAEYASTIEVYQDKIVLGGGPEEGALGNVFRLGRVSLFFLSLDNSQCAVFNPGSNQWDVLGAEMLPAVRSAVEIGRKHRTVELLPLPLGRLAVKGGAQ